MAWVGGDLKSSPLQWAGALSTRPACWELHPAWTWPWCTSQNLWNERLILEISEHITRRQINYRNMLTALIHMFPSTAMACFRSNQNYISVKISTTILKKHTLTRQEHKHMSKVQGHCGIANQKIRQQSFSFEKCCSSSPLQNRPQSLVRLIRRKQADFQ